MPHTKYLTLLICVVALAGATVWLATALSAGGMPAMGASASIAMIGAISAVALVLKLLVARKR